MDICMWTALSLDKFGTMMFSIAPPYAGTGLLLMVIHFKH